VPGAEAVAAQVSGPDLGWLDRLPSWVRRLTDVGSELDDSEEARLRKRTLTLLVILIVVLSFVWVITYGLLGLYLSAIIPFGYQLLATVSLVALAKGGDFDRFRTFHLVLWLSLPFLLQLSLGGFVASSGVILWSLVPALGALIFDAHPARWFVVYLLTIVMSGLAEPILEPAPMPVTINVVFFVLNIGAVSGVIYFVLRYFMRGLSEEREKSERLLLNVLPAAIARRLMAGEEPIADRFEDVAVLFADVVEFTVLSEKLAPEEIVRLLDDLFTSFDSIADRWGLEKIKTVGDSYMAVGGLPVPRSDAPEAATGMGLEMLAQASGMKERLQLRVGIDVGPVSAGVIGKRKFSFDLWGDTVNTASRMESHGVPGRIQVTERAFQRLRYRYLFEPRGPIRVKGKGLMTPYLLVEQSDGLAKQPMDSSNPAP
jgi:class 3 adenylate cyclase